MLMKYMHGNIPYMFHYQLDQSGCSALALFKVYFKIEEQQVKLLIVLKKIGWQAVGVVTLIF